MSNILPGRYNIISVLTDTTTGVNKVSGLVPKQRIVHLEGEVNAWNIDQYQDPTHPHVYHFSDPDPYPAGVNSTTSATKVVVLNQTGPNDVYWYITQVEGEPSGTYTIAWDHDHEKLWTVADPNNEKSEIVFKEPRHNSTQWFKFAFAL